MSINKDLPEDYSNDIFPGVRHKPIKKEEIPNVVNAAKNGDEKAFIKLLCHLHKYLVHLTKEFFIQGAEAKDVYQEGAIKLTNVISKYDESKGSFTYFAQSSIRKHIITSINKEQSKKRSVLNNSFSLSDETKNKDGETVSFMETLPDVVSEDGFVYDIIQKNHEEFLIEEISKVLSPLEQKIFVLRFMEGYSYKEIAEKLNLTRTTSSGREVLDQKSVDNAIWRSRPKIKKVLERLGLSPEYIDEENYNYEDY